MAERVIKPNPKRRVDKSGQRFGRLLVIKQISTIGRSRFLCKCDCGNEVIVDSTKLGVYTNSCGCLKKETTKKLLTKHGETNTRLHNLWCSMRQRCNDPNSTEHHIYHDRGIRVCDEWQDYGKFRDWALANGYDPNAPRGRYTIDRIDNNKGYSPDNCRLISQLENARNKSNAIKILVNGETITLGEAAEKYNVSRNLIYERLRRGWDSEKAVFTPPRKMRGVNYFGK